MTFYWYHASAIALKSLNLTGYDSFVEIMTILITKPSNCSKLSTENWYSENLSNSFGDTNASALPSFLLKSIISSPNPSPSTSTKFL